MTDDSFDMLILGFERAWQRNDPPKIAAFLEQTAPLASQERLRLLMELICIDLEFRWRNSSRGPHSHERLILEDYASSFPELGPLDQLPLELIGEEYRVRSRWGDRPTHAEFLSRFQARQEQMEAELVRIDRQLKEELAESLHIARPKAQADQNLEGTLLSHHDILLQRMIGAGRMGKVYQAWQHSSNRAVAVKFLRKSLLHEHWIVQRFIGEARTIAMLRHPNIVGIHGLGRTPSGSYFIVMDLVAGPNLALVSQQRRFSVDEAIGWATETCAALEHAHAMGIIHCDLKPANLVLDEDGSIRVTDFGLARSLTESADWTGEVEGTAPFMAPEQASRYWGQIDTRTDIYGIGAVLYTLLTGRPPWVGRALPDVLAQVISAAPVMAPTNLRRDLPDSLSDICRRCLSKAQADRFQTVEDVRSALAGLIHAS